MTELEVFKEAKEKYLALEKEAINCKNQVEKGKIAEVRLREIIGGWKSSGEIGVAKLKAFELQFPVFSTERFSMTRIIDINEKWILLKNDDAVNITRFKIENGRRERSRDERDVIDVKKSIKIWDERPIKSVTIALSF